MLRRISEELWQQTLCGCLAGGTRLPTEAELAAAYGVNVPAVRQAQAPFVEGGIDKHQGGTFVTHDTQREARWAVEMLAAQLQGPAAPGAECRQSHYVQVLSLMETVEALAAVS